MRPLSVSSSAPLSLASPPDSDTVVVVTNSSSVEAPYRPEIVLRDVSVQLSLILSPHVFNPTHLYWNIYGSWVNFWRSSVVTPITDETVLVSVMYPTLGTIIEPISGNNRLTTAVAQAVLGLMLAKSTDTDVELSPALFRATLSTRAWPSIPIGRIVNTFTPGLNTAFNGSADATTVSSASTNKTSTVSNGEIKIWLEFNGQDPRYPRITPKTWLNSFTRLSLSIFSRLAASDRVFSDGVHRNVVALSDEQGPDYRLIFQVVSRPTPRSKVPLDWEELVAGLLLILQNVIGEQTFESFDGVIYKGGWVAATCAYYYVPKPSSNRGSVAAA
ncbi:MAG: hypothetical protein LQ346_008594 [Caloplaca aetnensis]|nr:MAG: hypothetical protein LQ346_008594 [Caloplaca aetnensis]